MQYDKCRLYNEDSYLIIKYTGIWYRSINHHQHVPTVVCYVSMLCHVDQYAISCWIQQPLLWFSFIYG